MIRFLFSSFMLAATTLALHGNAGHGAPESPPVTPAATSAEPTAHPVAVVEPDVVPPSVAASVQTQRDEAKGLLKLGTLLTERKDYPNAEHAFRNVIERRGFTIGERKDALLGLARLYRAQGNLTKSAAILEKYIAHYTDDARLPSVMLECGRVLRAMGAYQLAIARFYAAINSTLKVDRTAFEEYQVLARTAQFEVAETYYVAGNYAEAAKYFRRVGALDLAPADRARAQFKAAYAQQLGGDSEGAVLALQVFVDQWPEDEATAEARFLLATTLRSLGRDNAALMATMDLLKHERPRSADGSKRWVYWQRRTGNQLANDFFQNGDVMNALVLYKQLVAMSSEPAWQLSVRYQMALCEDRLGQNEAARKDYQTIVDQTAANADKPMPDDLAELGRMAAWRLGQIEWRAGVEHRLATVSVANPAPVPSWNPSSTSSSSSPNSTSSPSPKAVSSSNTDGHPTTH